MGLLYFLIFIINWNLVVGSIPVERPFIIIYHKLGNFLCSLLKGKKKEEAERRSLPVPWRTWEKERDLDRCFKSRVSDSGPPSASLFFFLDFFLCLLGSAFSSFSWKLSFSKEIKSCCCCWRPDLFCYFTSLLLCVGEKEKKRESGKANRQTFKKRR